MSAHKQKQRELDPYEIAGEKKKEDDDDLPDRGTGLDTGRAGPRRKGKPRTDEERRKRHKEQTK